LRQGTCVWRVYAPEAGLRADLCTETDTLAQKCGMVNVIISQITRGSLGALDFRKDQ
jgi:hypothetical protein